MHDNEQITKIEEVEKPPDRKRPWILDIFLYPASLSGLLNLGAFWILLVFLTLWLKWMRTHNIYFICRPFPSPLGLFVVISLISVSYMFCYYMECIKDSARGWIRAPESMAMSNTVDTSSMGKIIACFTFFWAPALFYYAFVPKTDAISWLLLGYGIFFFPMGLLAMAMFGSTSAFNPFMLIASIYRTFFRYCGLVLSLCFLSWLFSKIPQSRFTVYMLNLVFIYLAMVYIHLLGRFYFRYREKLKWEV